MRGAVGLGCGVPLFGLHVASVAQFCGDDGRQTEDTECDAERVGFGHH
jgi:hypothetical protein